MKALLSLLSLAFLGLSVGVQSQSMTVTGGSSFAADCYQRSIDTGSGSASFLDIQICDSAILASSLSRTDLLASYVNRGVVYASLAKFDRAASDYAKALDLADDVAEVYLNRGNLEFLTQHWQAAIDDYAKAQELDLQQTHVFYLNRGMAYENMGDLAMAEADYLLALDAAPDWPVALQKLERLGDKQLDIESAEINDS